MRTFIEFLRNGTWFTEERVVAYSALAVAAYLVAAVVVVATAHGYIALNGEPLASDYVSFWTAGSLALQGHAAAAYDPAAHAAQEAATFGRVAVGYVWSYPPTFLLVAMALAALPYGISLLLWLTATGAAYVTCLKRIHPHPRAALVALALPAVLINAGHGQNGFLTTALLGGGLLLLEAQPLAAGVMFAALGYKPQMALLVPLALLAGRHWRALGAMAFTSMILYTVTTWAFGRDIWPLAFETMQAVGKVRVLEQGAVPYWKMVTIFAGVREMGGGVALAWLVQWIASFVVGALIVRAWLSRRPLELKAALLVAAVPLATPFCLDYDLLVLALPVAWLARDAERHGFLAWERSTLVAACLLPAFARPLGALVPVPLAPLFELALLVVVARRMKLFS